MAYVNPRTGRMSGGNPAEALMQIANMLAMQKGQAEEKAYREAQMKMDTERLKQEAAYKKAVISNMEADQKYRDFNMQQTLDLQAGQAGVAKSFAEPGGVEGLKSTGAETQWEKMYSGLTPEQQANPSYILGAFGTLGGAEAMREEMPGAAEIYNDVQAYAALSLGNPDIEIPSYLEGFAGNIDYLKGEIEKGTQREEQKWDFDMQKEAFSQGELMGFNEDLSIDEITYPEGLGEGYEQFFYAGVRKTREALKQSRYRPGGASQRQAPDAITQINKLLELRQNLEMQGLDTSSVDAALAEFGIGAGGEGGIAPEEVISKVKGFFGLSAEGASEEGGVGQETNWNAYLNEFVATHNPETIGERMGAFKGSIGVVNDMYEDALSDMMAAIENGAPENIVTPMQTIVNDLKGRLDRLSNPNA